LILDEATSALDWKNEAEVQAAIDRLWKLNTGITTIIIAHRLSTIKDSDTIIVMRYGEIVEKGNHQTLLENYPNGVYSDLVRK